MWEDCLEAPGRRMDEDLLDWLQSFVGKVVEDGEQYAVLRSRLDHLKTDIESNHQLKNLHVHTPTIDSS